MKHEFGLCDRDEETWVGRRFWRPVLFWDENHGQRYGFWSSFIFPAFAGGKGDIHSYSVGPRSEVFSGDPKKR